MKQFSSLFVSVAAAAMALVSCQVEDSVIDNPAEEAVTIRVHASANELKSDDPATKTYIDNTNTILWGTGEYMKLALTAGENTTFANSTDASADTFNGNPEAMFEFSVTPESANEYVYQGLYPASAASTSSNTNAANYKVNLPAIQNATASSYDPAAYIMVAKPETFTSVQTDWVASFRRGTALNKITLKNVPSGVSFKRVKITAEGKKLAGGRHFDLTAGEGTDVYGNESTIEVHFATPLTGSNVDVWFTSWNVEIAESETLTIVAYTTDKKSYTKAITVPAGRTIKFQEGYLNTLGANLSGIDPADVTEFEAGDYVVLAKSGSDYFALKAEKEAGKERLLSVEYTGNLDSYYGDAELIWTITKSGDSFTFENDSKYLGYKGSDNESYWLEADANWTEDNYLLDVTPQETAGQYYVALHSDGSRYLSKNSSGSFFAFYGNTTQKADIVFVPATVDTRMVVTLSFAEDAISKTTANYDEFTGQTATASPAETDITDNITYALSGDAIGTVNASTGVVSLNGDTGTATITASFAGDANYRAAEASYTIVVSSASGPQYELVTAANEVVEGDYIITWNNTYYLPSGSTSGTNPAVGTGITVAGDKITNTVTSDMVWTFTGDNTNGFTISDGTNILHSTNAAQGISITTDSERKWTVSVDGTYGMLLHGDDGGSRYLAVYNSGSWRYYSTGNSYTGVLRLYKLASGPAVTWNLESIAVTTVPTKTTYTEGESFNPAGMVVTGHFVDADDYTNTKDEEVTGYTITPDGALSTTDDHVTITYQGKTATQAITVNPAPAGNDGSLEHPYTASEASALAISGDTGSYYISGIVTKIQNQYSASYGTANFWIDENGTDQTVFEGYKIKYFGNVNWVEGNAEIALNDEVIIYGTLTMYNTTPETSSGYLVSLNGKTKGLTLAAPTVTTNDSAKQITVAWTAATGTESAVSYVINCGTQSYNASDAGSHTFTMADYGTYSVSVEATASDAVSATLSTSAILTDPSSATPYYVKVTDLSTLSANDKVIVINMNHNALPAFTSTGTISESDISSAYDSTNDRFSVTSAVANCAITLKAPTTTVNGKTVFKLFMSNNNYITKTGTSGTGFNPVTTSTDVGGDWTLSMDSNGRVNVKNNYSGSTRCLIWRAGSTNKFGAYASSNVNDSEYYNVYLYKLAN